MGPPPSPLSVPADNEQEPLLGAFVLRPVVLRKRCHMNDAQRDLRPTADTEPAVEIIEQWIRLREARGMTREAAIAELNAASSAVAINLAHD